MILLSEHFCALKWTVFSFSTWILQCFYFQRSLQMWVTLSFIWFFVGAIFTFISLMSFTKDVLILFRHRECFAYSSNVEWRRTLFSVCIVFQLASFESRPSSNLIAVHFTGDAITTYLFLELPKNWIGISPGTFFGAKSNQMQMSFR